MSGTFKNDPDKIKETFGNEKCRAAVILALRKREAEMTKALLEYHKSTVEMHSAALNYIQMINKHTGPDGKTARFLPEKTITNTQKAVGEEHKAVLSLISSHNKKSRASTMIR